MGLLRFSTGLGAPRTGRLSDQSSMTNNSPLAAGFMVSIDAHFRPISRICGPLLLASWITVALAPACQAARPDGTLSLSVVDAQSGEPLAAMIRLRDARDRPVRLRAEGAIPTGDWLAFDGEVDLPLKRGPYRFDIDAGPEYQTQHGHFTIDRHAEDSKQVPMNRKVDMHQEGWWAGDLDVQQRRDYMPLLMRAAHVDFAPLLVEQNLRGKCKPVKDRSRTPASELSVPLFGPWASLDRRRGGGLLLFGPVAGIDLCELPADGSSLTVLQQMDTPDMQDSHAVALTPFAWDLPLWLASGRLDGISIIHRHALVDGVVDNEAGGRPRDKIFYPGKLGNGRWSEAIYQHVLECGLRIPPTAGSGSGTNTNPVGAGRMYVQTDGPLTRDAWWQAVEAGRVMVTNGPLLRVSVEGHPPGHVFGLDADRLRDGEARQFQIGLNLSFRSVDPVDYLEVVKNGRVEFQVRLDELAKQQGRLPNLTFRESGWFLVRAVTANTQTYQFASTGPYYVEADSGPRISRKSVQFFLDWLDEAAEKFAGNEAVQADITAARPFWEDLLQRANAK